MPKSTKRSNTPRSVPLAGEDRERQAKLERVAHLYRRRWTQSEIAAEMNVSQKTVSLWLDELREAWSRTMVLDLQQYITEELDLLREIQREAWAAWDRSKGEIIKVIKEYGYRPVKPLERSTGRDGKKRSNSKNEGTPHEQRMVVLKKILTREGRVPAAQFLQVIMDASDAKRRLLGLDAPRREAEGGKSQGAAGWDWAAFQSKVSAAISTQTRHGCERAMQALEAAEAAVREYDASVETPTISG